MHVFFFLQVQQLFFFTVLLYIIICMNFDLANFAGPMWFQSHGVYM